MLLVILAKWLFIATANIPPINIGQRRALFLACLFLSKFTQPDKIFICPNTQSTHTWAEQERDIKEYIDSRGNFFKGMIWVNLGVSVTFGGGEIVH